MATVQIVSRRVDYTAFAQTRRASGPPARTRASFVIFVGAVAAWAYNLLLTAHLLVG